MSPRLSRVNWKSHEYDLRDRQQVMKDMRSMCGAGSFVAKHANRFLRKTGLKTPTWDLCVFLMKCRRQIFQPEEDEEREWTWAGNVVQGALCV